MRSSIVIAAAVCVCSAGAMLTSHPAFAQAPGAPATCSVPEVVVNEPIEGTVPDVTQFFFQGGCVMYEGAVVLVENGQQDSHNPANWSDVAVFHVAGQPPIPGQATFQLTLVSDSHEQGITDSDLSAAGIPMTTAQLAALPNTVFLTESTTGFDNFYTASSQFGVQRYDFRSDPATGDFAIAASPSSVTALQGASASCSIGTVVISGDAQPIALSASGLPVGASAAFSPNVITTGAGSTLTLNAGTAAPGTYPMTIKGTTTAATHSTPVSFTIVGVVPTRPGSWGKLKIRYR